MQKIPITLLIAMNTEELEKMKEVEFYASAVNAWYSTKLETDRTILTLSTGAIGLLTTLIITTGTSSLFVLSIVIFSIICFVICTISIVMILGRNAKHLEDVLAKKNERDSVLGWLDRIASYSFIIGMILAFLVGMSAGIDKYSKLNGAMDMAKQEILKKSFDGVANLRPASGSQGSGSQSGTPAPAGNNSGGSAGTQSQSSGNTSSANSQKKD